MIIHSTINHACTLKETWISNWLTATLYASGITSLVTRHADGTLIPAAWVMEDDFYEISRRLSLIRRVVKKLPGSTIDYS